MLSLIHRQLFRINVVCFLVQILCQVEGVIVNQLLLSPYSLGDYYLACILLHYVLCNTSALTFSKNILLKIILQQIILYNERKNIKMCISHPKN